LIDGWFVSAADCSNDDYDIGGVIPECNEGCCVAVELLRLATRERDARATDALRRLHDLTTTAASNGGGGGGGAAGSRACWWGVRTCVATWWAR
jgi:hypothetical protein